MIQAGSIEAVRRRWDAAMVSELAFIPPVIAAFALLLIALRGLGRLD
jgi:hypothetical protein